MKTIAVVVCAAAVLVASTPVAAQSAPPLIDADLVGRLCPVTGMAGLKLGAARRDQPPELLRTLRHLPDSFLPFTEAELETTSWSGRVAAITYRVASADGDVNDALLEGFDAAMIPAGWEPVVLDRTITPLSILGGRALEREVDGPVRKQKLLLEFDASGALALRCGDPVLLALDQREREGTLEPGSLRPVAPPYDPALRLPASTVCQSPAVQQMVSGSAKLDDEAPELAEFAAAASQESDLAHHAKRLNTWLEWKLLGSGKLDDRRLVALREKAAKQDVEGQMRQMMDFLAVGGELSAARESGDAGKGCEAFRKLMVFTHDRSRQDAAYWNRVNVAVEAEAKRLGVDLGQ